MAIGTAKRAAYGVSLFQKGEPVVRVAMRLLPKVVEKPVAPPPGIDLTCTIGKTMVPVSATGP